MIIILQARSSDVPVHGGDDGEMEKGRADRSPLLEVRG